jgi:Holliday junction resolvase
LNDTHIGDISVCKSITYLLEHGYNVLRPFGDGLPYDLVTERENNFVRIQCKTAHLSSLNVIRFHSTSSGAAGKFNERLRKSYVGLADIFSVYWPKGNQLYFLPVDICTTPHQFLSLDIKTKCSKPAIDYQSYEQALVLIKERQLSNIIGVFHDVDTQSICCN